MLKNKFIAKSNILGNLKTFVTFFSSGELDTLALGQADVRLTALTNHKNVAHSGSEGVTGGILNVHNIERTRMSFPVHDGSNTSSVTASSDHAQVSSLEFDGIHDFTSVDVQPDGIIGLNDGIGVANSAAIGGIQVGDILGSSLDLTDTAQFVLGLLVGDPVDGVTSLDIIDQTEVLAGLFNLDDIHETSWESGISSDFAVDLDQSLFHNCLDFLGGQSVLQAVSQEN